MSTASSHGKRGALGCFLILIACVWLLVAVILPGIGRFLKASWPTWGLLVLTSVLLGVVRQKKESIFCKAANRILIPVVLALTSLMGLEVLFGLFRSFFDAGRVSDVENAILRTHFVIKGFKDGLGYFVPIITSVAVVFLCLSVGNWRWSSALAKVKHAFAFVSLLVLVLSSFTFFGESPADVLLTWEREQNQRWYKMALADEQRSIARFVASVELYEPIRKLDANSKVSFQTFFTKLRDICESKHCFRGEFDLELNYYDNPSAAAFDDTVQQKVLEDYAQFLAVDGTNPEPNKSDRDKLGDALSLSTGRVPPRYVDENHEADIDLSSSKMPQENLLSRSASSEEERQEQREAIKQQRQRSHEMKAYEREAKHQMTEAFASVLSAAVPDMEGIIGAYTGELIDDTAEWVVRPIVDHMYKQGYRPQAIQDLGLAIAAVPATVDTTFAQFHAIGTRSAEISHFDRPELVERSFDKEQEQTKQMKDKMKEEQKEFEKEKEGERE